MTDAASGKSRGGESLDWLLSARPGFGRITPEAEFRYTGTTSRDHTVAETWWFEVSDAVSGLSASFYVCYRPHLGICSAGTWMWRGDRREQMQADHLNFQVMLPAPRFDGSRIIAAGVGLEIDILKPFELIRIRYRPPGLDASAELEVEGLFAPVMRANERHFEQATWTRGTIVIGGERFEIDGPSFRDRSFGEARREDHVVHPPIGWLYGVVGGGSGAFNLSGCDHPDGDVVWRGAYELTPAQAFYDGWIIQGKELKRVVSMRKRTRRNTADRLRPLAIDVEFEDEAGATHRLRGSVRSSFNLHFWPHINSWFGLTDWELDGVKGIGGAQDYAWTDYCRRFWT